VRWSDERVGPFGQMRLGLHKQLPRAKTPREQESLKRTTAATDTHIDALVYELYGLTEEEVGTVEGK